MRCGDVVEGGGMSDCRDPAVKLFGRKVPQPEEKPPAGKEVGKDFAPAAVPLTKGKEDKIKDKASTEVEVAQLELHYCSGLSNCVEDEKKGSTDITKVTEGLKPKQDDKETDATAEDKIHRRPDKVLQCPRCNSMDTKFCYYNNYNVNQPRYFCKNCQRYWTSGGMMRNVPVGAGRRKNKHSASSYLHTVQADTPDLTHYQAPSCSSSATMAPLKVNGTVQKFGPDTLHCELTTSMLNIEEQKKAEEPSCSSSVTATKFAENDLANDAEQKSFLEHQTGVVPLHNLQCFPVAPWAFAWNPGWSNVAPMSRCQTQLVTAPAFCAPIPFALAPSSFLGWVPSWMGWPWSLPLIGNHNGLISQSSSTNASNCSGNGSPTLGKHCRDVNPSMGESKLEKSLWVPKTLRIDDIDEAAKSSIFSILGIKPDEDGLFRTFSSNLKKDEAALRANPAALSRSQAFQETDLIW